MSEVSERTIVEAGIKDQRWYINHYNEQVKKAEIMLEILEDRLEELNEEKIP